MRPERFFADGAGVPIELIRICPAAPIGSVLVIHGWGGSADDSVGLIERFADIGYCAIAPSMRGWGRSGGEDDCGLRQPDDIVEVVTQVAADECGNGRPLHLCGISQGGQVALLASARQPLPVASVAAWAPVTDVARWRVTHRYPGITEYIDRTCADGDLRARSPLAHAASISSPVLLVHGTADRRVPFERSRLLAEAIRSGGGSCRLDALPSIGHGGPEALELAFAATAAFFSAD